MQQKGKKSFNEIIWLPQTSNDETVRILASDFSRARDLQDILFSECFHSRVRSWALLRVNLWRVNETAINQLISVAAKRIFQRFSEVERDIELLRPNVTLNDLFR